MELKIKESKFRGQISINKNPKLMKLVACDSSQDVHFFYKKNEIFWLFIKKLSLHRNFIQIIIGSK